MLVRHIGAGLRQLQLSHFATAVAPCPFCGPSVFVRLNGSEAGVRCLRCASSPVHCAMGWALRARIDDLAALDVCELSARGPLVEYLRRHTRSLAVSEYFADVESGTSREGVRCEDVQCLSYADASFDLMTHTEVLEHVPDDAQAFGELYRVLRSGGLMVFTVPLHGREQTIERARLRGGKIEYLLDPVYHADPLRGGRNVLAFRDYGYDILERLHAAGFPRAERVFCHGHIPWVRPRDVIVADKA
ncbi:MAG: class I SAM-dependent methyltransferase [Rhodanobacteraceae bacterium]